MLVALCDNLVASCHLERLLCGSFRVLGQIPLGRQRQTGVELPDASEFVDFLDPLLVFLLQFLDGLSVGTQSVSLEQVNLSLVERNVLLLLLLFVHFKYVLNQSKPITSNLLQLIGPINLHNAKK